MIVIFALAFLWATLAGVMPATVWYAGTLLWASLIAYLVGRDDARRARERARQNE